MTSTLYWHPESSCLFWSDVRPSDELSEPLGDTNAPDARSARRLYEMNVRQGPPFDEVYRPQTEPKAQAPAAAQFVALEPERWRGGPPICPYENLPAFDDMRTVEAFRLANGMDSMLGAPMSILRKWRCPKCGNVHVQMSQPAPAGGSSGTTRAYSPSLPRYERERLKALEI